MSGKLGSRGLREHEYHFRTKVRCRTSPLRALLQFSGCHQRFLPHELFRFRTICPCSNSSNELMKVSVNGLVELEYKVQQLRQFVKDKKFAEAFQLYTNLKESFPCAHDRIILSLLAISYRYARVYAFGKVMKHDILKNQSLLNDPGIFDIVINGLSLFKKQPDLQRIKNFIKEHLPDRLTEYYYHVIITYVRLEQLSEAHDLLDKLKQDSIQFDAFLYGAEMSTCVNPISVVRFKEVWNRMQEARISPNGEVLDVLLLVLHKTNCTNELLRVMMELPKAYKVKRTGKNFLLAMKNCIHNKRFLDAIQVFKLLEADRIQIPPNCYELALYSAFKIKDFLFGTRILCQLFQEQKVESPVIVQRPEQLKDFAFETIIPGFDIDREHILRFLQEARKQNQDGILSAAIEPIRERFGDKVSFLLEHSETDLKECEKSIVQQRSTISISN